MLSKDDILAYLKELKPTLQKEGIEKIGLFGSFAKDSADLLSDIDIVIKTNNTFIKKYKSINAFLYLDKLRENIKKRFNRDVDICDESGLKNKDIIKDSIYV